MSELPSAGEAGGIVAGVVAVLALLGGGIKWLFDWNGRREDSRAAKLQRWHEELEAREDKFDRQQAEYQAGIEAQLKALTEWSGKLQREHAALLNGYQLLAGALRAIDPANPALRMGDDLLKRAFPLDPITPADMLATASKAV